MTDSTREDFERWAVANTVERNWATWSAYQQGIADARKPSSETENDSRVEAAMMVVVSASSLMSRIDRANELHAVFTVTDSFEYRDLREKLTQFYKNNPSTETAAEWIARHEAEYQWDEAHAQDCCYLKFNHMHRFAVIENATGGNVCINLETADDCIKLCEILRVTPVERAVG